MLLAVSQSFFAQNIESNFGLLRSVGHVCSEQHILMLLRKRCYCNATPSVFPSCIEGLV